MGWCVKPWGRARRRQRIDVEGANAPVSLWRFKPQQIGGTPYIIDQVAGVNNGLVVGNPTALIDPILGPGLNFNSTSSAVGDYIQTTVPVGMSSTTGTIAAWARFYVNGPIYTLWCMDNGWVTNSLILWNNGGNMSVGVGNTLTLTAVTPNTDTLYHYAVTWDQNATPNPTWILYVNGVAAATGNYAGTVTWAQPLYFGYMVGAGGFYMNGDMFEPRMYSRVLSSTEIMGLARRSENAVVTKTDWGALQSVGAEGGITGAYVDRTKWRFVDTTVRVSIQDGVTLGTETLKYMIFGIGGALYQATTDTGITPTEAAYGTWEYLFYKNGDGDEVIFAPIASTPSATYAYNGYHVIADSNEALRLQRRTGLASANLISTVNGAISLQTWYIVRLTRRYDGLFSLYYAPAANPSTFTLVGTATDNTYTTALYRQITASSSSRISLGSLSGNAQVSHRGGVITP